METLTLEIQELQCVRGYTTLFTGVNFALSNGTAMHLHGANGCGKTSLLRILAGLSLPDNGTILFNGQSIRKDKSLYLNRICYHGHQLGLKLELNAYENLSAALALGNADDANLRNGHFDVDGAVQQALETLEIDHAGHLPCGQLSAGQKQRIALARTILSQAPLWILDEPGTALDVSGLKLLETIVCDHVDNGGIAIFTSHQDFALPGIEQIKFALDEFAAIES